MSESYGLPLFLWTSTSDLRSTTFADIYGRQSLWTAQFLSSPHGHLVTGIGGQTSTTHATEFHPSIVVDLNGAEEEGWAISGGGRTVSIPRFLQPLRGSVGIHRTRSALEKTFTASDGQRYEWRHQGAQDPEPGWTCTSSQGYLVAHYSVEEAAAPSCPLRRWERRMRKEKRTCPAVGLARREPSAGGMLVVNESWTHIVEELIATLIVLQKLAHQAS